MYECKKNETIVNIVNIQNKQLFLREKKNVEGGIEDEGLAYNCSEGSLKTLSVPLVLNYDSVVLVNWG